MAATQDIDLMYFSALRLYGNDHHVSRLLAKALHTGSGTDIETAHGAISVLPPHERARFRQVVEPQ